LAFIYLTILLRPATNILMFSNCLNYARLSGCLDCWTVGLLDRRPHHESLAPDAVSFICKVLRLSNIECFNLVYQRETLCCCPYPSPGS